MAETIFFGLWLLGVVCCTRINDQQPDRVLFGARGETIHFLAPDLTAGGRRGTWPSQLEYYKKVELVGDAAARTGFALHDFGPADVGRFYTVRVTNNDVINFRAALAHNMEVDVGTTLHMTPDFRGDINSITWRYTSTSTTKVTDLVSVLDDGKFQGRIRVNTATGKLSVYDWRACDDGFFTAEINGQEFAENFKAISIVRVQPGGDLHLAPTFDGHISQFSWYHDNTLVVEYMNAGVVYKLSHCLADTNRCDFDPSSGKLTIKSWQHSFDGVFTMMINGVQKTDKINVKGGVVFAEFDKTLELVPPPFNGDLTSIVWFHDNNLAADFDITSGVTYYQICNDDACVLNTTTGVLTISGWLPFDTRYYTVEVNLVKQSIGYITAGVSKLDDFDADVKIEKISDKKTRLVCDGDFEGAEPVTYFWKRQGTTSTWVQGTKSIESTHFFSGGGRPSYMYDACKIKNPVSERVINLN